MNPFTNPSPSYKWCHVVCTLARQRQVLKIPATARFCERSMLSCRLLPHTIVAAASLSSSQIRLLLRLPARASRKEILRSVRRATARVLRNAGVIRLWEPVLWGSASWCFVLRSVAAVAAVRRHMYARNATMGTRIPLTLPTGATITIGTSVREEITSGKHDVLSLRQHEILQRGRVR
jgi:REP element-mobilizing transposase RayT